MRGEKLSVEEASKILGISPNEIRKRMRDKTLPIGTARVVGRISYNGRNRYAYDVFVPKLLEYTGLSQLPN